MRTAEIQVLEVEGLRVLLRRNRAHEVVAARFVIRGGAANTPLATAGIEAMMARTARRGTGRFPKSTLNGILAALGADLGAVASHDATAFNLRCLRRHFDAAWDVYADVIVDPLFAADEIELVRRQMLLDIRQMHDSPDGALGEIARRLCYDGHPYAADPHGTEASVSGLDAALMRAHGAQHWTRANALLVVVGDIDPETLAARAATFARLPAGSAPAPLPPRLAYARHNLAIESRELPTNYILGEFAAPALRDPDHAAMLIATSILRDRFFEEVRTKRNLSYAPSASLGTDAANLGSIYVTAADPTTTLAVMHAEMRKLAGEPLDARDLADKVKTFVTRWWMQSETNQAQASALAGYEMFGGGWERSFGFVERLEAVRPEDVQHAAATYFTALQYSYLGDPESAPEEIFVYP